MDETNMANKYLDFFKKIILAALLAFIPIRAMATWPSDEAAMAGVQSLAGLSETTIGGPNRSPS